MKVQQQTIALDVDLPAREVLRIFTGGTAEVSRDLLDTVNRLLNRTASMLEVQAVYAVTQVENLTDQRLTLGTGERFEGQLVRFVQGVQRMAPFVATVGNGIEDWSTAEQQAGHALEARALRAIAFAASEAAADAVVEFLWGTEADPHEGVTVPFIPGCCGIPIEDRAKIFRMVEADAIGVKLLADHGVKPATSVIGLVGFGEENEIVANSIPCERCENPECKGRRGRS